MKKLKDRILLGLVSGLVGGVVKNIAGEALVKRGYSEYSGPQRAAGILVPAHKITTTGGKIIGWLAEASISGLLGIATVYTLSLTGKDKALLKGIFLTGGTAWTALYGAMGTVGATRVQSPMPKTVISESITHGLYGAATAATAAYLGDDSLFNGSFPLSTRGRRNEQPDLVLRQEQVQ
ncbi:MAG: hypothetical protein QM451_06065 [Bacillota bacterium]|jgi:hypothetical protein|nr:hypothetical protein [Bacillota bacterium]HHT90438.1 hypothetical protein [Bacillota bacterium]